MPTALVALVAVVRPSGRSDFQRWKAALPNMAGNAFGKVVPSFAPPYLIEQSSDMRNDMPMDEQITGTFLDNLKAAGFDTLSFM